MGNTQSKQTLSSNQKQNAFQDLQKESHTSDTRMRPINWKDELKILGVVISIYAAYHFVSTIHDKSTKSVCTQTDNRFNLNRWNMLHSTLKTMKAIMLSKKQTEDRRIAEIEELKSNLNEKQLKIDSIKKELNMERKFKQQSKRIHDQLLQHKEQQIVVSQQKLETKSKEMDLTQSALQEAKDHMNEQRAIIQKQNKLIERLNISKKVQEKVIGELSKCREISANNKIRMYNDHLSSSFSCNSGSEKVDYILDFDSFEIALHAFGRIEYWVTTAPLNRAEFDVGQIPKAIILKIYRLYHWSLNVEMTFECLGSYLKTTRM